MKVIYKVLAVAIAFAVIVASFLMVFIKKYDPEAKVVYDGLGRALSETPLWVQFLLSDEAMWAGLGWHFIDIFWFFGGFWLAFFLFTLGDR